MTTTTTNLPAITSTKVRDAQRRDRLLDGALLGAGGVAYAPFSSPAIVEPFRPKRGPGTGETVFMINGVVTHAARQAEDLQAYADATGNNVIGIHNATDAPGAAGLFLDLSQALGDKLHVTSNPATATAARILVEELLDGRGVKIAAHSQGAVILSNALQEAKQALLDETKDPARVRELLGKISVETFGGAAATFIDGPTYLHHVNDADPVPVLAGVGHHKDHAKNTVVDHFTRKNVDHAPIAPLGEGFIVTSWAKLERTRHGLQEVYVDRERANALNAQISARLGK